MIVSYSIVENSMIMKTNLLVRVRRVRHNVMMTKRSRPRRAS